MGNIISQILETYIFGNGGLKRKVEEVDQDEIENDIFQHVAKK